MSLSAAATFTHALKRSLTIDSRNAAMASTTPQSFEKRRNIFMRASKQCAYAVSRASLLVNTTH